MTQLVAALAVREPLLLVLDDVDLAEDAAALLARLVRSPARILVTTSRRLDLPHGRVVPLDGLTPPAGAALYRIVAEHAGARLPVDEADLDTFVRAVDGLPLAIVLAARHADTVPPSADLGGEPGLDRLAIDPALGRHASIRTAFDRVWARCTAEQRRALRACAEFLDPFPAEAAAALGADRALEALLSRSLLSTAADGRRAYRLLGLVRAYVLERSAPAPELAAAHAVWFADEARRIVGRWRTHADAEHLLVLAGSAHDFERAVHVAGEADAADIVWLHSLWLGSGAAHAERAAALTRSADPAIRQRAWIALARFRLRAEDLEGAEQAASAADAAGGATPAAWMVRCQASMRRGVALEPAWTPGDALEEIDWLGFAALWAYRRGDRAGTALARRARDLASRRGDRRGVLDAEFVLACFDDDPARAGALFARCAEACRAEEQLEAAFLWASAGRCWTQAGHLAHAAAMFDRADTIATAVDNGRLRWVVDGARLRLRLADADPAELLAEAGQLRTGPWGEHNGDQFWFVQAVVCAAAGLAPPEPPPEPIKHGLDELVALIRGGPAGPEPRPHRFDWYAIWHLVQHHRTGAALPRSVAERAGQDPLLRLVRRALRRAGGEAPSG